MICIDKDLCTGCSTCVADCVSRNIEMCDGCAAALGECFMCGHCVAICPTGAVTIPNYQEELVEYSAKNFDIAPENMLNTIKFRRSVRDYKQEPVSMEHLHLLIDAAGHTATAVNRQQNRFFVIQNKLPEFKELIWDCLRSDFETGREAPVPRETLERFLKMHDANAGDFLFRNAPMVIGIDSPDALDAGLAASAIEMMGTTLGIGVLYNGYLRRIISHYAKASQFLDCSGEVELAACMLVGYSNVQYARTAPRRRPSTILR